MATRCRRCRASYFPPMMNCPKCLPSDVEWFEIKMGMELKVVPIKLPEDRITYEFQMPHDP